MEGHINIKGVESGQKKEARNTSKEWTDLGAKRREFDGASIYVRERRIPYEQKHGRYTFKEMVDILERWETCKETHPLSCKGIEREKLLFFDTETTGLSSGAGTQMFLLGYAKFTEEDVLIRQFFLPGPEAEVALYHHFLADVASMDHLVTFNGKAFDWPRLKTRHTFVRDRVPKLPKFGHFDLLHGARRLWKDTLPSCGLGVIEEEKLCFTRSEDTPSYLVPMLYFDFVREQDPSLVEGVFCHHEWDLLSLIALYAEMTALILGAPDQATAKEIYEIARWYEAVGEESKALILYEGLLIEEGELALASLLKKADLLKKQRRHDESLACYKFLLRHSYQSWHSATQCALLLEHHSKNVHEARLYADEALAYAETAKEHAEAVKRVGRLRRKAGNEDE
ncbi:ribonuclease H-like domain-containing protein [Shouchella shacheensis]|uniref:ribonuclease H-like domain-containing protein n=1 Tax=Shouchella shacheensis TaxID=1649580 RepID=UPI00073FDBD0|nr:ribonuclease H-like domain-containing protein [Shouchella shacheensis]